jgi:hypothetical protein
MQEIIFEIAWKGATITGVLTFFLIISYISLINNAQHEEAYKAKFIGSWILIFFIIFFTVAVITS